MNGAWVKVIACNVPCWELGTAQRWLRRDGEALYLSGYPIETVEVVGETVILYARRWWWSIRRADYEKVGVE